MRQVSLLICFCTLSSKVSSLGIVVSLNSSSYGVGVRSWGDIEELSGRYTEVSACIEKDDCKLSATGRCIVGIFRLRRIILGVSFDVDARGVDVGPLNRCSLILLNFSTSSLYFC